MGSSDALEEQTREGFRTKLVTGSETMADQNLSREPHARIKIQIGLKSLKCSVLPSHILSEKRQPTEGKGNMDLVELSHPAGISKTTKKAGMVA